jgi:adenylate cyclase
MGDAIMAFWNAPLDDTQHADNACKATVDMASKLKEMNAHWAQQAAAAQRPFEDVKIGIGINTGECCVGNMGSSIRFDYSAIGDEVNVTSRLEGLSKIYGVTAVIGEGTLVRAQQEFPVLELDIVAVKGRGRATRVYTLLGLLGVLDAYRRQRWDDAERTLADCRVIGIAGLETYYSLFATRIAELRHASLLQDWDGSFAMTEK